MSFGTTACAVPTASYTLELGGIGRIESFSAGQRVVIVLSGEAVRGDVVITSSTNFVVTDQKDKKGNVYLVDSITGQLVSASRDAIFSLY